MPSERNGRSVLVVDDDDVIGSVLSRVLVRDGYTVHRATSPSAALSLADKAPLDLALLDLCYPDGDGVELARDLHARHANLPVILMTAYPLRLRDRPELTQAFDHVLNKPINLDELRQAINATLGRSLPAKAPMSAPTPTPPAESVLQPATANHTGSEAGNAEVRGSPPPRSGGWQSTAVPVAALLALALFGAYLVGVPVPGMSSAAEEKTVAAAPPLGVQLVKDVPHTVNVPEDVRLALGIRKRNAEAIAVAKPPTAARPLILPGTTTLDPTRTMRIRARFAPAEVIEIATNPEMTLSREGHSEFRELRSGDRVKKGQLLAVFSSVDVGSKKNDLIDALVQLKLDQEIQDRAEKAALSGSIPEVFLLSARRNVEADRNAIARALNTLKTWSIPDEDIQAVQEEAEKISQRKGQRDKSKEALWARVELKAPDDGTIVERNVTVHEMVVDNTVNLFQLARVDRMVVVANAPEDDLPTLLDPSFKRQWKIQTVGTNSDIGISGPIDEISYLIDVNQHNAVVKGHIDNPGDRLRAGQFVSATIELPPPKDVVELPVGAVVDDGKQSVVFVQPDPAKPEFTLRRVQVTHRFEKTVFVRSQLSEAERQLKPEEKELGLLPKEPLQNGERVLTAGVLELKKEIEDRESNASSGH